MALTKMTNYMGTIIQSVGKNDYQYKKYTIYLTIENLGVGRLIEDEGFLNRLNWNGADVLIYFPEDEIVLSEEELLRVGELNG